MNRKELIEKFKQTIPPMGIYQIRNMINGKVFIGSSQDLKGIINRSEFQLKNGLHMNKEMQRDFSEIGEANFSFEVLDQLKPIEDAKGDYTKNFKCLKKCGWKDFIPMMKEAITHRSADESWGLRGTPARAPSTA